MRPMTKASSVRHIHHSYETSSYSEDDSSRDCEYAVDDLCPRSNEWRRHSHPKPRWCLLRLNWRLMRTFADLSYEKLDRIPCRLNTLHRAAVGFHQSQCIACAHGHCFLRETANLLTISNQTNLAIKGIIAIKAMSVMSEVAGQLAAYSVSA
jgi:hypothetical protein